MNTTEESQSLRLALARRGAGVSGPALVAGLGRAAAAPLPAGLVHSLSTASLSALSTATSLSLSLISLPVLATMTTTKIILCAAAILAVGVSVTWRLLAPPTTTPAPMPTAVVSAPSVSRPESIPAKPETAAVVAPEPLTSVPKLPRTSADTDKSLKDKFANHPRTKRQEARVNNLKTGFRKVLNHRADEFAQMQQRRALVKAGSPEATELDAAIAQHEQQTREYKDKAESILGRDVTLVRSSILDEITGKTPAFNPPATLTPEQTTRDRAATALFDSQKFAEAEPQLLSVLDAGP